ncbi:hypothetical protein TNCV_1628641 [Trichonephila clavipes]|nr:hypothetical protein TNCV_1628641 [Trichonephila clavipes]
MDVCKCTDIVPVWPSGRKSSREVDGKGRKVGSSLSLSLTLLTTSTGFFLKIRVESSQNVLSPLWLITGVALCRNEFGGPRSD